MKYLKLLPAPGAAPIVILHTRESIEAAVEVLLARLDALDGDPDLEPEEDRGGDEGEPDFRRWRRPRKGFAGAGCPIADPDRGMEDFREEENLLELRPVYAVDQSTGPVNEQAAYRVHQLRLLGREQEADRHIAAARAAGFGATR
jgi:hypothetical protein